ncbi:MAG TPA: hypothetical protein QF753_00895 [Victivallales bacterium]|nr:hypothetical protein [Victivallales bacterium]|tara:strand:- start:112 stop:381 length:270 start_codon:yes stop_codon:yes gene_type:complete
MCINLGHCVSRISDESTKFNEGNKASIKIYIDKYKKHTLCLEVEILSNDVNTSYIQGKVLKIGDFSDKDIFRNFLKAKNLTEGSMVKFV